MYRNYGKRVFDFLVAGAALVVLFPVLLIVSLLVRMKLGVPIFFRQQRAGRLGRLFSVLKFRTMTNACDAEGALLSDEERLTTFGQFLRSSSLDELPELWNVVRGEMSLVGPRPLHGRYLDRYTSEQSRRHEVQPGITGWAQVNGRNNLGWEERFELDVWYVENVSLWLDLKILFQTVIKVVRKEDVNADGHATMPEFMGEREVVQISPVERDEESRKAA